MAEKSLVKDSTAGGRVRLLLIYDDVTGMTQAFSTEADPGQAGTVTFRMVIPPNFDQSRSFTVLASGGIQGRDRVNIPANRQWNLGLQSFEVDTNGDGVIDGTMMLPTADDPEGISYGIVSWAPAR